MIEFSCRHCATKYKVREALCGRTAECKTCGRRFTVPYASPVVRLGDEDLALAPESDNTAANDETKVGAVVAPAAIAQAEAPLELSQLPPERPASSRPAFSEHRRRRKSSDQPADEPLLPMPAIASELWLPLVLAVVCLGASAYLVLDAVLQGQGRTGGLVLIAFGAAALLVIAYRLTLRSLESAAHTFDLRLSDAIALQTVACLSVPVLGGVFGLVQGGLVGTAVGAGLGALLCPLLMTVIFQLPAGKGLQSGLIASVAFLIGYACSALLVAGVANVMFTVWSVDLPWKLHPDPNQLAAAESARLAAAPRPATTNPSPAPPASPPAAPTAVMPTQTALTPAASVSVPQVSPPTPGGIFPDAAPLADDPPAVPGPTPAQPPAVPSASGRPTNPSAAPAAKPASPMPPMASAAPVAPAPIAPIEPAAPVDPNQLALADAASDLVAGRYNEAAAKSLALQKTLPKVVGRLSDPVWIDALHLQAVAQMKLGQASRAAPAMVRVFESGKANRSIVINAAVCDILNKTNVMRAVKNLQAYAATHPDDELTINLWGVALDTFARREKGVKIDKLADDFVAANTLLERTRPGQHHWGTAWVSGGEWAGIETQRASATSQMNNAQRQLRDANVRLDNANRAYQQVNVVIVGRPISDWERSQIDWRKRNASDEIDAARRAVESAKVRVDQAKQQLPRPTWAMVIEPVEPELLSR